MCFFGRNFKKYELLGLVVQYLGTQLACFKLLPTIIDTIVARDLKQNNRVLIIIIFFNV